VAPVRRNVIAPALRRDHPVANTAVVAARPRAWCADACLVKICQCACMHCSN
jgi:hypothetical protein